MAHTKSAIKSLRTSREKHVRNKAVKSRLKTLTRHYLETVDAGKLDDARTMLPGIYSEYDKAAKKGVIKTENADRHKGRLALKVLEGKPAKPVKKKAKAAKKAETSVEQEAKPEVKAEEADEEKAAEEEAQPEVKAEEQTEEAAEEAAEEPVEAPEESAEEAEPEEEKKG